MSILWLLAKVGAPHVAPALAELLAPKEPASPVGFVKDAICPILPPLSRLNTAQ
jgi:hypothetical protein